MTDTTFTIGPEGVGPNTVAFGPLPQEIVRAAFFNTLKNVEIRFFSKRLIERSAAWDLIKPGPEVPRNPWRKMHTENFWAWYRPSKEVSS